MIDNEQMREVFAMRAELTRVTAERDALRKSLEERDADVHRRVRASYDATIADCWRAEVARVEAERDALRDQLTAMRSRWESASASVASWSSACSEALSPRMSWGVDYPLREVVDRIVALQTERDALRTEVEQARAVVRLALGMEVSRG